MSIDIEKVRKETPGCRYVLHFNNAGAALMPQPVIDAITGHFTLEVERGGYEAAAINEKKIAHFYDAVATLLNANRSEIAFIENATRAWDMVFYSLKLQDGDRIITSEAEYASNYIAFLQAAKHKKLVIDVIPNDKDGQLSLEALEKRIARDVKLIAITHVPTQGGLINPAEEVGKIAKNANIFYLLDATQSVGQMPIDVKKIQCDALCATGRKYLRGPRGTGFLYVSKRVLETLEPPFLDLHAAKWTARKTYEIMSDARRFETWETAYALKIGLATAVDYALEIGIEDIWERVQKLSRLLREKLALLPGVVVADLGRHKCGIVSFYIKNKDAKEICLELRKQNVNVSVTLQEHARLDLESRGIASLVRASVHYYNTEEEICHLMRILDGIQNI